mgnify:CR=1 FL=1
MPATDVTYAEAVLATDGLSRSFGGLIAVRGAVPGAPGGDVIVRPTSKGV